MSNKLLTDSMSEPLNGTTKATIDSNSGSGNLTIDTRRAGKQLLASTTLEYFEKQGRPSRSISSHGGQTMLKLSGGGAGQPWFRLPWSACNAATDWEIHLNPAFRLTSPRIPVVGTSK